jgi:ribose-phosphate pyrophosphokinase
MMPVVLALPGSEAGARRLARALGAKLGVVEARRFPDRESYLRIKTRLVGRRVIIAAALDNPDDKFLPLLSLASLARDLGAGKIGLVCPYLPYMRQDKRFRSGEAVTSGYFARQISEAFDWLVTVDPHLHRRKHLSDIYSIPTAAVQAAPLIAKWIRRHVPHPLLVGPDSESLQWVKAVANEAQAPYAVLRKLRSGDRTVRVSGLRLSRGTKQTPVLVDDIVSTARTMIETVKQIRAKGGPPPVCIAVHGLFVERAYAELQRAGAGRIVSCNTVSHRSNAIDVTSLLVAGVRTRLGRPRLRKKLA